MPNTATSHHSTDASTPALLPWWQVHPHRWRAETSALRAGGARYRVLPSRRSDPTGSRRIRVRWPTTRHPVLGPSDSTLEVLFGASYPWFAPEVRLRHPHPVLQRHRNPRTGHLCLLADPGDWHPHDLLANVLEEQLARIVEANTSPAPGSDVEERAAEGVRTWLGSANSSVALLVDSAMGSGQIDTDSQAELLVVDRCDRGLVLALASLTPAAGEEVRTDAWFGWKHNDVIDVACAAIHRPLTPSDTPRTVWKLIVDKTPNRSRAIISNPLAAVLNFCLLQVPDETAYRQLGHTWVLLYRFRLERRWHYGWTVANNAGPDDLLARQPELQHVRTRSIAVIGVGAIGHQIAMHLARAGVGRLVLVDGDIAEAETACRQTPLTTTAMMKVDAVKYLIRDSAPSCHIAAIPAFIGSATDEDIMDGLTDRVDVIVDAAASRAATRHISRHARAVGVPVITVSATYGGYGGTITTQAADVGSACWACVQLLQEEHVITWPPQSTKAADHAGCSMIGAVSFPG